MSYHNNSSSTQKSTAKATTSLPTTNAQINVAPIGYHYMPDGTLMADVDHNNQQCNEIYFHLFSMCHSGIEPYNFKQGSVLVWEGSPNFISRDCETKNLLANNNDFYLSLGQPSVGQAIGLTDRVGMSCMIYVGYIPYPVVNPVKITKLVTSTSVYDGCSDCVNLTIKGCTDSLANNYNPLATVSEGGCEYTNLPCTSCCLDTKGNQYTPTQPCICESGYVLSNTPCVVVSSTGTTTATTGTCIGCCYNESRGVYKPVNDDCSCGEGDMITSCKEDKSDVVLSKCTNCCTNKSGRMFNPTPSAKYGCACLSGSWSVACEEEEEIKEIKDVKSIYTTESVGGCVEIGCEEGKLFDRISCKCVSTLVDTCEVKIDSTFNETLAYLPISNHLDIIRGSVGGHTKLWSTYKFKHYPKSQPTNHKDLCLAEDSWGDVKDSYWAYVKNVKVTYTPAGSDEMTIISSLSSFSDLYTYTASTLPVTLDNTKEVWEAMEVWNNDTTIWTPGLFSLEYSIVYCDCYDSLQLPDNQEPRILTESVVNHVFGGKEGVYIIKEDTLTNYKCVSGTNPVVGETQQTCAPTEDPVGGGVYDNINACINSGCAGYMQCYPGVSVDGVEFVKGEKTYTPIVMCCERLIKSSDEPLTKERCQSECGGTETWYPLYNAFAPNLINESLLGYMVRDLLNKVNNRECTVSKDSKEYRALGYVEKLK
jgi:hypothetical protein